MLKDLLKRQLNLYGFQEIPQGIFYNFPIGIRFEIGEGEIYNKHGKIKKIYANKAAYRSKKLYQEIFPLGADLLVFQYYVLSMKEKDIVLKKFKKELKIVKPDEISITKEIGEDAEIYKVILYWDLSSTSLNINRLLREITLADIGGFSHLVSSIYLFDTRNHIIFHYYDDRGLDIVALTKDKLMNLYEKYNLWILDYDREKINKVFKG